MADRPPGNVNTRTATFQPIIQDPRAMNFELARFNMVEQQIRPWDVLDQAVLDVIGQTPRDLFVPEAHRNLAYADLEIPLGHGEFMMPPRVEGRMIQTLEISPADVCLEVGTGSGYVTCCMAKLGAHVDSVEIRNDFLRAALKRLEQAGVLNATLQQGDAANGWTAQREHYDVIAVTGSLPEYRSCFEQQLNTGGRLFVVVGDAPVMEALRVTRLGPDEFVREKLFETCLKPLCGTERKPTFTF
jgi:protein-L-isoaspartate(D-aspartate) O-methyltransferase